MNEAIFLGRDIIGVADGPTSVFIAGRVNMGILVISADRKSVV